MPKITQIRVDFPRLGQEHKKRVAAYARVSRDSKKLLHSLSAQVSYYSSLIQGNSEWEFAGVYADEAITGTLVRKRDEFRRMLGDCEEGKIDIILTKSIQRFARNTVDLLEAVRHLKDIGVEVRFEKEHISTMSGEGELMLTILASFAQEEVRSLSDNVRWARKKKIDAGEAPIRMQVTGYTWDGDSLVVDPGWAPVIKRIFNEYIEGKSPGEICRDLNNDGMRTIRGHIYRENTVYKILKNPIYKGDLLLQKTYIEDPITKVQRFNTGEMPMVLVEDDHEPIIDAGLFDAVQEERKRRKEEWDKGIHDFEGMRLFTHKVKCGITQRVMIHSPKGSVSYGNDGAWACNKHEECPHRGSCGIRQVPDLAIRQAVKRVLDVTELDFGTVKEHVDEITVPREGALTVRLKDGTEYEDYFRGYKDTAEKQPKNMNYFSRRLICGCCGGFYRSFSWMTGGIRVAIWGCRENKDNSSIHENVLKHRVKEAAGWDEFSFRRFRDEVDHIDMDRPCHMVIRFKDGRVKETEYYSQ